MLKFIIKSSLLYCFLFENAQSQEKSKIVDSSKHFKMYGLRVGMDLVRPILSFTKRNFNGLELVSDYRIRKSLFLASELGYAENGIQEDFFNHFAKGYYFKLGLNYNIYKHLLDMENEIFFGCRYAVSFFEDKVTNYTIFQKEAYFPARESYEIRKFYGLNAHWIEFVMGIKVEVLKNIFLGFSFGINNIISINNPEYYKITYSPGFGKILKNKIGKRFTYVISYKIPFFKK